MEINEIKSFFSRENLHYQLKAIGSSLMPKKAVNIKLNVGGGSYTDGTNIVVGLPELFYDKSKEDIVTALVALLGHEMQHVKSSSFTDFMDFQKDIAKTLKDKHNISENIGMRIAHSIGNSVEDGRIEKILCNHYPGYLKKIKFLNGTFWEEQPIQGQNELQDFFYTLVVIATSGLYPKGYSDFYENSDLDKAITRIKPLIYKGINAKDCKTGLLHCREIFNETEDYLVPILKEMQQQQDLLEQLMERLKDQPNFKNDEETEFNEDENGDGGSQSISSHFVPEPQGGNQEDRKSGSGDAQDGDESKEGNSSGNSMKEENSEDNEDGEEDNEKGSASGKEDKKDSQKDAKEGSANGADEKEDSSNQSDSNSDQGDSSDGTGVNQVEDEKPQKINSDEENQNLINQNKKEVEDELKREAKEIIREIDRRENREKEKRGDTTLTKEEVNEIMKLYRGRIGNEYVEFSNFPLNHKIPQDLQPKANKLRRDVENIFKNQEVLNLRNQKKGVLDSNNLWKVAMKDYNVFARKGAPVQTDCAVYILQDGSGSMSSGNKRQYSAEALAIIEEGFKGLLPLKIVTFDANHVNTKHHIVKEFSQNRKDYNYAYSYYESTFSGNGNKDGLSIRVASEELMKRPEKCKILVILSDGLPSAYESDEDAHSDVNNAIKIARKNGIFTISIMFGNEHFRNQNIEIYRKMYEKNIISCEPEDISHQLTKILKKAVFR